MAVTIKRYMGNKLNIFFKYGEKGASGRLCFFSRIILLCSIFFSGAFSQLENAEWIDWQARLYSEGFPIPDYVNLDTVLIGAMNNNHIVSDEFIPDQYSTRLDLQYMFSWTPFGNYDEYIIAHDTSEFYWALKVYPRGNLGGFQATSEITWIESELGHGVMEIYEFAPPNVGNFVLDMHEVNTLTVTGEDPQYFLIKYVPNLPPLLIAIPDTLTIDEDTWTSFSASSYFTENEGEELTYEFSSESGHIVINETSPGVWAIIPEENYHGISTLSLYATDIHGQSNFVQFWIRVLSIPDAPVATNVEVNPSTPTLIDHLSVGWNFSDGDGDSQVFVGENATRIHWYKNYGLQMNLVQSTVVDSSLTDSGDVWYAWITPSDGSTFGDSVKSNEVTVIGNTPPNVDIPSEFVINEDEQTEFDLSVYVSDLEQPLEQLGFSVLLLSGGDFINFSFLGYMLQVIPSGNYYYESGHEFVITVDDGSGGISSDTSLLKILPINDPPELIGNLSNLSANEDNTLIIQSIGDYYVDVDLDPISISANGTEYVSASIVAGDLYLIPEENYFGSSEFYLSVSDYVATIIDTFIVSFESVDDPPYLIESLPDVSVLPDPSQPWSENLYNYFGDVDDEYLQFTIMENTNPLVTSEIFSESILTITPPDDTFEGSASITIQAQDDEYFAISDQFSITFDLSIGNTPPVFINPPMFESGGEGEQIVFQIVAMDEDGHQLQIALENAYDFSGVDWIDEDYSFWWEGAQVNGRRGIFNWLPGANDHGEYLVAISVYDGSLKTFHYFSMSIQDVNFTPVFDPNIPDYLYAEVDNLIQIPLEVADPDNGDTLTIEFTNIDAFLTYEGIYFVDNGDGTAFFEWQLTADVSTGSYTTTFRVTDSGEPQESSVHQITLDIQNNLQHVPQWEIPDQTEYFVDESGTLNFSLSATDPDGDGLYLYMDAIAGIPSDVFHDNHNNTGTFTWTTDYFSSGSYSPTFLVFDEHLFSDTLTITINVNDVNRPPYWISEDSLISEENTFFSTLVNAVDDDNDDIVLTLEQGPNGVGLTDHGNGTGTLTWDIGYYSAGEYLIFLKAEDSSESPSSAMFIITLFVENVNQIPVFTFEPSDTTINEGDSITLNFQAEDPDGDSVEFILDFNDEPMYLIPEIYAFTDHGDGSATFFWQTSFEDEGFCMSLVTAKDPEGATSEEVEVVITVLNVNRSPYWLTEIDTIETVKNDTVQFVLQAFDPDDDALNMELFSYSPSLPENLSFDDGTGEFHWIPDNQSTGFWDFSFKVWEYQTNPGLSDTLFLTIQVINQPPYWVVEPPKLYNSAEGDTVSFSFVADDADGDELEFVFSGDLSEYYSSDGNGSALFSFEPDYNESGIYSLLISASDGDSTISAFLTMTIADAGNYAYFDYDSPWSWISYNVNPIEEYRGVVDMFAGSSLIILMDAFGNMYIPGQSYLDPEISEWTVTQGYAAAMDNDETIEIVGTSVEAENIEIELTAGWNFIAYLPEEPMDVSVALADLVDVGKLAIAKARLAFYIPNQGTTFGDMMSGQGYKLGMWDAATLIYPAETFAKNDYPVATEYIEATHFEFISGTIDYHPIVLNSLEISGVTADIGDELGIFANGRCIGGSSIRDFGNMTIIAWEDDNMTDLVEGYQSDDKMEFKYWNRMLNQEIELKIDFIEGDGTFQDFYSIVSAIGEFVPESFSISENYPNPFNPSTKIQYLLPEDANVLIRVFDVQGREVSTLLEDKIGRGYHELIWNGENNLGESVSSGIYFLIFKALATESGVSFSDTQKMILLR